MAATEGPNRNLTGQLVGRYEVRELIGQGGMGAVYLGFDPDLHRPVVIKVPHEDDPNDPDRKSRLRKEAHIHGRLLHENIVRVYDFVTQDGVDHIVSEYVEGGTLMDFVRAVNGHGPMKDCLRFCLQVARGISYAHENGIIHRDLKLANVVVTKEQVAKITDFGLSRSTGRLPDGFDQSRSGAGGLVGTFVSMSPEQTIGEAADHRSDVFALGVLCYEVVCGRLPFAGRSLVETLDNIRNQPHTPLRELRSDTPLAMSMLVDRMLEKRSMERPPVGEVVEALEQIALEATGSAHGEDDDDVEVRSVAVLNLRIAAPERSQSTDRAAVLAFQRAIRARAQHLDSTILAGSGRTATICVGIPRVHERPLREALRILSDLSDRERDEPVDAALVASMEVGDVAVCRDRTGFILVGSVLDMSTAGLDIAKPGELLVMRAARRQLEQLGYQTEKCDDHPQWYRTGLATVQSAASHVVPVDVVGRADTLNALKAEAVRVFAGSGPHIGRTCLISGEAGVGKSALVAAFTRQRLDGEPHVVNAAATTINGFTPFGVFIPLNP